MLILGWRGGDAEELVSYDPDADAWNELTIDPLPAGVTLFGDGVWTGSEILLTSGIALDPRTGAWRILPASPLADRWAATTIWTGHELVVWGGCDLSIPHCDDHRQGPFTDGAIYEPSSDSWRKMAPSPLPPGTRPSAAWTGTEVIYYAGLLKPGAEDAAGSPIAASYDPARDRWTPLPDPPFAPRQYLGMAWSRESGLLFAWGGSDGPNLGDALGDGAAFDPSTMNWLTLPDAPRGTARDRHVVAAVDNLFFVDGGWPAHSALVLTPE